MVSILTSGAVDHWFKQTTIHTGLRRKSKDCLARNQDNVYEWGDMSICRV